MTATPAPSAPAASPPATPPIYSLLSEADLQALQAGYSASAFEQFAAGAVCSPFPPSLPWLQGQGTALGQSQSGPVTADNFLPLTQEQIIIALLAGLGVPPRLLAIHIYKALTLGLSLQAIGYVLLLTGMYSGVQRYSMGLMATQDTLAVLADCIKQGKTTTAQIIPQLLAMS